MDPLITIETVPISIEYIEKETKHTSSQHASLRISRQEDKVIIQSNPIHISLMDSFKRNISSNWNTLTYKATAQYSGKGNLSINLFIENGDSGSFYYEQVNRGIDNIINYVPTTQSNSNHDIESMQINFDISGLPMGLPITGYLDTSFLPPDIEIKVVEQPKVIIKYVGGPLYIPKSADPNYVAPEEHNQIVETESSLDVKA